MTKTIIAVSVLVAIGVCGALIIGIGGNHMPSKPSPIGTSGWMNYSEPFTGFSMEYPPTYKVEASAVATNTPWTTQELLTISAPSVQSPTEFGVPTVHVTLIRQPVISGGTIYHSAEEYQQSGVPQQMVTGATNPSGTIVELNSGDAVEFSFPKGDATDTGFEDYYLIHNDLIFEVALNDNDPLEQAILNSIQWR